MNFMGNGCVTVAKRSDPILKENKSVMKIDRRWIAFLTFIGACVWITAAVSSQSPTRNVTTWDQVPRPDPAISGGRKMVLHSDSDGWQVGRQGKIWRLQNGSWQAVSSPTDETLYALEIVAADDVWAGGANGTMLHWNGSTWQSVTGFASGMSIQDISMVDASYGMATVFKTAASPIDYEWLLFQWDGSSWSQVTHSMGRLDGIDLLSRTDGWVMTNNGFWHWDGTTWTIGDHEGNLYSTTSEHLTMINADLGFALEGALNNWNLWQWDGASWSSQSDLNGRSTYALADMVFDSDDNIWFLYNSLRQYKIAHWNGAEWTEYNTHDPAGLRGLAVAPSGDAWVHGDYGTALISNGVIDNRFDPVPPPNYPGFQYVRIDALAPDDVWAAGNPTSGLGSSVVHWDGVKWEQVYLPDTIGVVGDLEMVSADEGHFSISGGKILYWDGTQWEITYFHNGEQLQGGIFFRYIDGVPGYAAAYVTDADAVDDVDYYNVYEWDGTEWTKSLNSAETGAIGSIKVLAANQVVIYAANGTFLWDGSTLQPYTPPVNPHRPTYKPAECEANLSGLKASEDGTIWWLFGYCNDVNTFYYWTGTSWIEYPHSLDSPYTVVRDMAILSPELAWAVTEQDYILQFSLKDNHLFLPILTK